MGFPALDWINPDAAIVGKHRKLIGISFIIGMILFATYFGTLTGPHAYNSVYFHGNLATIA
jgi:hypothetical protein